VSHTPPCLRRLAPARIDVVDETGRVPRIAAGFVHVRAGRRVQLRVVSRPSGAADGRPKVSVSHTAALRALLPLRTVRDGTGQVTVADLVAHQRGKVPFPRRGEARVLVGDAGGPHQTVVVPFAVWPSRLLVLTVGFVSVCGLLIWNRFAEQAKTAGPIGAITDTLMDGRLLTQAAALGLAVIVLLELLGWLLVWSDWMPGDAE
jgi:hypothetical protein